jgi:hypothetical protein
MVGLFHLRCGFVSEADKNEGELMRFASRGGTVRLGGLAA